MNIDITQLSEEQLTAALREKHKAKLAKVEAESKAYLNDKNNFATHTALKFRHLHSELKELKEHTIAETNKLYERMYALDGKTPKETKSFSIKNESDTIKIKVERQERFEFTDEAIVHINAIRDIFKSKFEQRHKGMYAILDGLLIKNSKLEYDPKLLAKARRQVRELGDEELISEFDKLDECQRVSSTALYCRLWIKDAQNKWQDVSLQFSSL